MPFRYSIRLAIGGWLSPTLFLRNIVKIGYSAKRLKVKGGGFYIAMLTKSRPAPLYNVADYRYERRRSTAPKAARLAGRRPCSRTKDFNPRPKPVPIYRPRRDERLGLPEPMRVNTLLKDVTHWCVCAFVGRRTRNAESRVRRANH